MPLIQCPDCGHEISDRAAFCPYCGAPNKTTNNESGVLMHRSGAAGFVITALVILYVFAVLIGFGIWGLICLGQQIPDAMGAFSILIGTVTALEVVCLISAIMATIRIARNKTLPDAMITYNAEKNLVSMVALNGKTYSFKPNDFIDISRNFFTDNIVIVRAIIDGRDKKIKLGWTLEYDKAKSFLFKNKYQKRN